MLLLQGSGMDVEVAKDKQVRPGAAVAAAKHTNMLSMLSVGYSTDAAGSHSELLLLLA